MSSDNLSERTPREQWQIAQDIQFSELDEPLCNYCARGADVLMHGVPFCTRHCYRDWLEETFFGGDAR